MESEESVIMRQTGGQCKMCGSVTDSIKQKKEPQVQDSAAQNLTSSRTEYQIANSVFRVETQVLTRSAVRLDWLS